MTDEFTGEGEIYRVSGPVVVAEDLDAQMNDVVRVGEEGLLGEVIQIEQNKNYIQVYEDTTGIRPGEPVKNTGQPLSVELGPGMLGGIYDGLQRPLPDIEEKTGSFIERGVSVPGIDLEKEWDFEARVEEGEEVTEGDVIGVTEEGGREHRILVPPGTSGTVETVREGEYTVEETVVELEDGTEISMKQEWPIREAREVSEKLKPEVPLVTGQRVLDGLFPMSKGGVAAIPGGFGTGKTVTQQQLAKWSDADIIVYIGCGERGNEMTEVLDEFPELEDPWSEEDKKLMERTVLIANTSNMPVAAREASIYTGITIAEYYRDQGYSVALMADSTSRWAEAMREVSARLEEMPGERGYPAYLASRLAEFYERAGRAETLGDNIEDPGSVSVIGAVSPPGGDFTEPVTQNTLRVIETFWALDKDLANKRHFPAISWTDSYSGYAETLQPYFEENVDDEWGKLTRRARNILQEDEKLQETVQLVGKDALPEEQQLTLEIARMIKEFFLQQNAFHDVDTFCEPEKTISILRTILNWGDAAEDAMDAGAMLEDIINVESKQMISNIKFEEEYETFLEEIDEQIEQDFAELGGE
ncbi:MAG: V-type ATP synthase subunit A [Candidatus Nanohaloarchaeota archaeon QJJ-5]|nr:V-type ATP synthase subunit A [Candidatus Nanohaloarchaeota archaeon QJJ-5]